MPPTADPFHAEVRAALRQLRLALGAGVILYGLDVRLAGASALIEPGLAFDGMGEALALDAPLPVPLPEGSAPLWLALRRDGRGEGALEVSWHPEPPADESAVPLARLLRGPAGAQIDRSAARRAPPLAHRHSGETVADAGGRLRFDGAPLRGGAPSAAAEELRPLLARLESAVAAEFSKIEAQQRAADERAALLALELEELRTEVAEAAERAPASAARGASGDGGWEEAIVALRDELMVTAGEELRAELDQLRADHLALAQRPNLPAPDMGSYTPIGALHGVGERFAQALADAGVLTVSDLLAAAADPEWRAHVERTTALGPARLRRWAREADLLRLHGAGPLEVAMLGDAEIGGSAALAIADAPTLYARLIEVAAQRGVAPPAYAWLLSWIAQARDMPPVVGW